MGETGKIHSRRQSSQSGALPACESGVIRQNPLSASDILRGFSSLERHFS
ncbi:MAG: hypothetical protein II723_06680 [Oscillospiraceae bacterium]|nr:hypothetical protein [Oscillospiraceae bacterium]